MTTKIRPLPPVAKAPRLMGITGVAGSGKDTAADYLCLRYLFQKESFAAPLKRAIETMFKLKPDIWDRDKKERELEFLGVSPRVLAQTLGTEWGRELICPDIWVKAAQRTLQAAWQPFPDTRFVFADVRFENEAHFIHANGGYVFKIERGSTEEIAAHKSEAGIPEALCDAVVYNNDSYEQLYDGLDNAIRRLV